MRTVDASARDDRDRHEGGHVVIIVPDLDSLADDAEVMVRPLDAPPGELGSLAAPQRPVAVRQGDAGTEIVLGPAVAEHPALVAGSIVEIEIADAGVRAEVLWPAITPSAKPRRPRVLGRRGDAPRGLPAGAAAVEPARQPLAPPVVTVANGTAIATVHAPATDAGEPAAAPEAARMERTEPELRSAAARTGGERSPPRSARTQPVIRGDAQRPPARRATEADPAPEPPADYVTFYPHARGGTLRPARAAADEAAPASSATWWPGLRTAAMTVATVLALQAALWLALGGGTRPSDATAARADAAGRQQLSAWDVLASGPVSPRGGDGRAVAPEKALENAQAALNAAGGRSDAEEAAYWLRRYLAAAAGDERTRRALTQLGTALADPSNRQGDLGKARVAWEVAGALGDPVAMCFLATVHERGLSVPADRAVALAWLERARAAGGCPGLDEAAARLRQP